MSFKPTPTLLCDFYKTGHRAQYPIGTEVVYSTWTPRSNKYFPQADAVITFGIQAFVKEYLIDYFNDNFFNRPKADVISEYTRIIKNCLLIEEPYIAHMEALHDLGYLPLEIKCLEEGTPCPIRVPMLTIENTNKEFFWLTNFLETLMSGQLWIPSTSATIAKHYRSILDKYALETVGNTSFVPFQGHDFSMRGMSMESAVLSGMGHLIPFAGSDTIPAIMGLEQWYGADVEKELVGCSVYATEHSVMCAGGKDDEFETYRRLIEDVYPKGIVSIVSDTWDLWHTLTDILPRLKESIMKRDGKVVIRPDSGDPVNIICGTRDGAPYSNKTPSEKGVVELLWDVFGGTVNDLGFKELDPHIGAIYGDAITPERATQICERLKAKGFASTNVVFGIGSYTYQYNTRDTFGFALKSTYVEKNGQAEAIFKDPITDDGTKKSLTGRVAVLEDLTAIDSLGRDYDGVDMLQTVFLDGELKNEITLAQVRENAK
jgi:nicotinamide phosphoribosyltransferase